MVREIGTRLRLLLHNDDKGFLDDFSMLEFDASKPDGTMRKVLDVSLLNAQHWQASKTLPAGIADTYKAYRSAL